MADGKVVVRRGATAFAVILGWGVLGWWAAHGNCGGENHLGLRLGAAIGASIGLATLAFALIDSWTRSAIVRFAVSAAGAGYGYAMLFLLLEPVLSGARCDPNYDDPIRLVVRGSIFGLLMGAISVFARRFGWTRTIEPQDQGLQD